jgi:tetratricopeptide (TPR) repeat protein
MLVATIVIVGIVLAAFILIGWFLFFAPRRISTIQSMLASGKSRQVIRLAKRILAREARSADAHYLLGLAFLQEKKPELALMELKTVNQLGDFTGICREIPFRKQIAELYWRFNQKEDALKEYLLLIKSLPAEADLYYKAGLLFEERANPERSLGYYAKAIQLDPSHALAHYQLGLQFYKSNKHLEARKELETASKLDPGNANAFYYLGKIFKDGHEYTAALAAFEKAQKDPHLRQKVLVERGGCYMSMNNFERAASELEKSLKAAASDSDPATLYGRYFLALCYEKARDMERAIGEWEKIYAKKPGFRDVAEKLSKYQELRADDSIKDYLTASREEFLRICHGVALSLGVDVQSAAEIAGGSVQVAGFEVDSKRLGTRKMPRLMRFYRTTEPLDESTVRATLEEMKKTNAIRGVIVTSSTFTRKALEYAENRPIDLLNRERLQELLRAKTGLSG